MPNILKIKCPNRLNIAIIMNAVNTALNATFFIIELSALPTIDTNTGALPIGFNIAKNPRKTVGRNKARSVISFVYYIICRYKNF